MSARTMVRLAGPPLSEETHFESRLGRMDPPWLRGIAAVYCTAGSPAKLAQLQLDSKFHWPSRVFELLEVAPPEVRPHAQRCSGEVKPWLQSLPTLRFVVEPPAAAWPALEPPAAA